MFYSNYVHYLPNLDNQLNQINLAIFNAEPIKNDPRFSELLKLYGTKKHSDIFRYLEDGVPAGLNPELTDALYELLGLSYLLVSQYDEAYQCFTQIDDEELRTISFAQYYRHNEQDMPLAFLQYENMTVSTDFPPLFFLKCEFLWHYYNLTQFEPYLTALTELLAIYNSSDYVAANNSVNEHFLLLNTAVNDYKNSYKKLHTYEETLNQFAMLGLENSLSQHNPIQNNNLAPQAGDVILNLFETQIGILERCALYLNADNQTIEMTKKLIKDLNSYLFAQSNIDARGTFQTPLGFAKRENPLLASLRQLLQQQINSLTNDQRTNTVAANESIKEESGNKATEIITPTQETQQQPIVIQEKNKIVDTHSVIEQALKSSHQTSTAENLLLNGDETEKLKQNEQESNVVAVKKKKKNKKPNQMAFFSAVPVDNTKNTVRFQVQSKKEVSDYLNKLYKIESSLVQKLNEFNIPDLEENQTVEQAVKCTKEAINLLIKPNIVLLMAEIPSKSEKKNFIKMHKLINEYRKKIITEIEKKYNYSAQPKSTDEFNKNFPLVNEMNLNDVIGYHKVVENSFRQLINETNLLDPKILFDRRCHYAYKLLSFYDRCYEDRQGGEIKLAKDAVSICDSYLDKDPLDVDAYIYRYFFNSYLFRFDDSANKEILLTKLKFDMAIVEKLSDSLSSETKTLLTEMKTFHQLYGLHKNDLDSQRISVKVAQKCYADNRVDNYEYSLSIICSSIYNKLKKYLIPDIANEMELLLTGSNFAKSISDDLLQFINHLPSDAQQKRFFINQLIQINTKLMMLNSTLNAQYMGRRSIFERFKKDYPSFLENDSSIMDIDSITKQFEQLANYTSLVEQSLLMGKRYEYARFLCSYHTTFENTEELIRVAHNAAELCGLFIHNYDPLEALTYLKRYFFNKILYENNAPVDRTKLIDELRHDLMICEQLYPFLGDKSRAEFIEFKKFHILNGLDNDDVYEYDATTYSATCP